MPCEAVVLPTQDAPFQAVLPCRAGHNPASLLQDMLNTQFPLVIQKVMVPFIREEPPKPVKKSSADSNEDVAMSSSGTGTVSESDEKKGPVRKVHVPVTTDFEMTLVTMVQYPGISDQHQCNFVASRLLKTPIYGVAALVNVIENTDELKHITRIPASHVSQVYYLYHELTNIDVTVKPKRKQPPKASNIFNKAYHIQVRSNPPDDVKGMLHHDKFPIINKIANAEWKKMTDEQKAPYVQEAERQMKERQDEENAVKERQKHFRFPSLPEPPLTTTNAYHIYQHHRRDDTNSSDEWKNMTEEQRKPYYQQAQKQQQEFESKEAAFRRECEKQFVDPKSVRSFFKLRKSRGPTILKADQQQEWITNNPKKYRIGPKPARRSAFADASDTTNNNDGSNDVQQPSSSVPKPRRRVQPKVNQAQDQPVSTSSGPSPVRRKREPKAKPATQVQAQRVRGGVASKTKLAAAASTVTQAAPVKRVVKRKASVQDSTDAPVAAAGRKRVRRVQAAVSTASLVQQPPQLIAVMV